MALKPELVKFNTIAPIIVQEYERYLPTAFDDSMTILEKMNKVIAYLNEVGRLSTEVITKWNEVIDWVTNDGLSETVLARLDEWLADGTLQDLINNNEGLREQVEALDLRVTALEELGSGDGYSVSIAKFGGDPAKTFAENKAALQDAIADVDSKGGGIVVVPPNMSYGYDRQSTSTHPDLTATNNNVLVIDFSESWSSATAGTRDGMQVRYFFETEGDEKNGMHDGNGHWIRAGWHPYLSISHDDPTADNRRASIMFNNDGNATWLIGQGTTTGATLTDDEKSNFKISGVLDGGTGLSTVMSILKTNGFWGFNVQSPTYDYHFMATRGAGVSTNGNYMFDSDKGGDTNLLIGTSLKMRKISLKNDDSGDMHISNNAGASNVVTFTNEGEVIGKGGVNGGTVRPTSPTAGCMYFDLTLNKPLWYRSAGQWFDATGTKVIG
jgi:hypothetical protein